LREKQNVSFDKVQGTIQNDILKEYIARGTYIYPPKPRLRLITDTFAFCAAEVPNWNTISISGYHIREAGSTAAQEIAFTLADGIAMLTRRFLSVWKLMISRRVFHFSLTRTTNLLEEVAKFRAGAKTVGKIMRDRFEREKPEILCCAFTRKPPVRL
jgi:methylmalonyl-CoA mutase N-terminal domain/subunit